MHAARVGIVGGGIGGLTAEVDVLVGADGIHSLVRRQQAAWLGA